jgi:hypothetical protein
LSWVACKASRSNAHVSPRRLAVVGFFHGQTRNKVA